MALHPLPHPSVRVVDIQTGLMQKDWYEFFRSIQTIGLANLPDVTIASLSNGQVLIWNSTAKKFENGSN